MKYRLERYEQKKQKIALRDAMIDYSAKHKTFLGSSKTTMDYKNKIMNSVDRYAEIKRDWLYAIVLPGGHGKTYLAEKHNLLDVDRLITPEQHNELFSIRVKLMENKDMSWDDHNVKWYKWINDVLDMYPNDKLSCILVHTEEMAYELGAEVLGTCVLKEQQFEQNIQSRGMVGLRFSRISRNVSISRNSGQITFAKTNNDLENWVMQALMYGGIEVAHPWKYDKKNDTPGYSDDLPGWVYRGDVNKDALDHVMAYYKQGKVPYACLHYYIWLERKTIKAISGYGISDASWGELFAQIVWFKNKKVKFDARGGDLFELFPPRSEAEKNRVNVTLRRLDQVFNLMADNDALDILEHHVGDSHIFCTGILSHHKSLGIQNYGKELNLMYEMYKVGENKWSSVAKKAHELFRLSNNMCGKELSVQQRQSFMYMEMLLGRKLYTIDYQDVLNERNVGAGVKHLSYDAHKCEWNTEQYVEDFHEALNFAYSGIITSKSVGFDVGQFIEFWESRREWAAKGSMVMNDLPPELKKYVISYVDKFTEIVKRHNKKSLFEQEDILQYMAITVDEMNITKVVPKLNESGKERALLPGTLAHYIIFSYVLRIVEGCGKVGHVRVNAEPDAAEANFESRMYEFVHLMYDWANFNAQHSKWEMDQVIRKLGTKIEKPGDYAMFCNVIADAMHYLYIVDEDGGLHEMDGGLYSGWRGTSWINGVLNYCYIHTGMLNYRRLGGLDPVCGDGGGDDEDLFFRNIGDSVLFLFVMSKMNFDANASKQMIDVRSEFFRNVLGSDYMGGNPTRALANFLSGNWESTGAQTMRDRVVGILDSTSQMERRGVDKTYVAGVSVAVMTHWTKIKMGNEWVKLTDEVIHGRVEDNCLGIPDEDGMVWRLDDPPPKDVDLSVVLELPGVAASKNSAKRIIKELDDMGFDKPSEKTLTDRLAKDSYDIVKEVEMEHWQKYAKHTSTVAEYVNVCPPVIDYRALSDFLDSEVDTEEIDKAIGKYDSLMTSVGVLYIDGVALGDDDAFELVTGMRLPGNLREFKFNPYYSRIVPPYISTRAMNYVRLETLRLGLDEIEMGYRFAAICYTFKEVYNEKL